MNILGIDPGTAITGYGVIRQENHNQFTVLGYGAIRTSSKQSADLRLKTIYEEIRKIIEEFEPSCMAVEQLFFNKNANSALAVGQARGVSILAGSHSGLDIIEYTPLQVKMAVTGYGELQRAGRIYG